MHCLQLLKSSLLARVLKLMMNNKSNGILPIDDNTLQLPRKKHPTPSIDEDLVERAALKTKQSSGQSGLDADG